MLPSRALRAASRFGFLIELTELVCIPGRGHEEGFLRGEIVPRASASIITKATDLSTKCAVGVRKSACSSAVKLLVFRAETYFAKRAKTHRCLKPNRGARMSPAPSQSKPTSRR